MSEPLTSSRPQPPQPGDGAYLQAQSSTQSGSAAAGAGQGDRTGGNRQGRRGGRPSKPQPGDGAYLAHSQPAGQRSGHGPYQPQSQSQRRDGPALHQVNGRGEGSHVRGGHRGRGGRPIGDRDRAANGHAGGPGPSHVNGRQRSAPPHLAQSNGISNSTAHQRPHSRQRQATGNSRNTTAVKTSQPAPAPAPAPGLDQTLRSVKVSQLQQPAAPLDPSAPSFTPGTVVSISDLDQISDDTATTSGDGEPGKKNRKKLVVKKENGAAVAPPAQLGRRAAFQQSTKLTQTVSRTSSEGTAARVAEEKSNKGKSKKDEPDDLVSRLTRGLKNRPLLECPICFNSITPSQATWCCLPPDHPPPPDKSLNGLATPNPITGSMSSSNHYSACYTPFHLDCIRSWANRSLVEEEERARQAGRDGEELGWRCPGCQKRRADRVAGYRCFCGRLSHPPTLTSAPHSCGDSCARKRPNCQHSCPLPCHPGPCPPCQVALIVPCPSHHTHLTVKCSAASSNNAALSPVCDEPCHKQLNCGNKDHECQSLCHYGECKPCDQKEVARCYCGAESKEVECGWNRKHEKICVELTEDGEETWWGKYDCGRECERLYDCGIHPCKQTCHPHPVRPLPCPKSPSVITHCPCGTTSLSALPGFPRSDCLAPIPTCGSKCPKVRPCGHPCPRNCHTGDCPPCHEEVVKACRCGQSQLLVLCDELREKAENGETEVTCERICRALRNCGRHECGRLCCPLWEQAKFRKRRNDDHDLYPDDDLHKCHLTCGKLLSCGLHTCPKPDHKGACGRCLQASYDELICNCGETVIYPPVACGTTINCPYPCVRPEPNCGHPKTQHPCHEQPECPPCPYLTTKPCACGKDPAVKNVRCSAEKVSCGQQCGELLECGYHRCTKLCHRPNECEGCTQTCGKPKKICKHACTAVCHAPARCAEMDPCQTLVTQSCACGHLQSRTSCGASTSNPRSREVEQLKCNSECAVRQRNARLADALGIKASERGLETWEEELKVFAVGNHGFVKTVEKTLEEFIKGVRQSMVLPHMPPTKRTFVMSLAEHYHLTRELIDQEPNRSVQIRRRVDTRLPNPLLSAVVQPPVAAGGPVQGQSSKLVTSLGSGSGSPWGRGGGGTAASVLAAPTATAPGPGPGAWGGGTAATSAASASASGSARPSRTNTPLQAPVSAAPAPVIQQRQPKLRLEAAGQRGQEEGEGDDWDVDL